FPTLGRPVTLEARFRASSIYRADGSGDAIGSWGVWLWNAPVVFAGDCTPRHEDNCSVHSTVLDYFAFGFNWGEEGQFNGLMGGFRATAIDKALLPFYFPDLSRYDIHTWLTAKAVWAVNALGVQTLTFFVNDDLVGFTVVPIPMPPLAIEIWQDNQLASLGLGGLSIEYGNPVAEQIFDLASITVSQGP
ncbi:MAG TPA: hypothetical protein VJ922_06190, partial [Actinomycetota bacterium]|nr:hypothetical protein [Actinomycetota bacterium]